MIYAPRSSILIIGCLCFFYSTFIEVLSVLGRLGLYIGWSIYSCILGSVLAVLGWRYWAGGRLSGVKTVTRGRVEAVTAGSDYWAGCGGLYKLSCRGSLALVNKKGEAGGASMDGASADKACAGRGCTDRGCTDWPYADRTCAGRAYRDGAYRDGACVDGAYTDGAYVDRACIGRAYRDRAYIGKACTGGAYVGKAYMDRAYNIIYSKSPISPGNGGFIYIKGPTKILLSLQEAKNPLVLI